MFPKRGRHRARHHRPRAHAALPVQDADEPGRGCDRPDRRRRQSDDRCELDRNAQSARLARRRPPPSPGSVVSTRYGDVEVQVTVASGKITAVQAIALPSGGRSGQISSYAAPVLASEAVTAQSATIDIVSGATYTSQAYAQSLQAALDQAGITTTATTG